MYEHIRIMANGQQMQLPEDFSIDYEDVNPLFNADAESGSLPANVPIDGNRFLLKNIDDPSGDLRPMSVEHTPMQVLIDGIPYRSGEMVISDGQEITDNFDFSINSYVRRLDDLIGDLECWDVPIKDRIQIGECLGDAVSTISVTGTTRILYEETTQLVYIRDNIPVSQRTTKWTETGIWTDYTLPPDYTQNAMVDSQGTVPVVFPLIGTSVPVEFQEADSAHMNTTKGEDGRPVVAQSFINTNREYNPLDSFYCNARICYPNHVLDLDGKTSDVIDTEQPYYVLEAERPGSGICFYVLYFLDCLFHHLGLTYSNENLMTVEDMKRLVFFTTSCSFDTERKYPSSTYDLNNVNEINRWLTERDDKRNIRTSKITSAKPRFGQWVKMDSITIRPNRAGESMAEYEIPYDLNYNGGYKEDCVERYWDTTTNKPASRLKAGVVKVGDMVPVYGQYFVRDDKSSMSTAIDGNLQKLVTGIEVAPSGGYGDIKANIMKMYANSKNFPQTSVTSIIDSLWASFGIRFVLDYERRTVVPHFIRDIFRSQLQPRHVNCKVLSITPVVEKKTGVQMRYSAESDSKDQQKNVRDGVRDYDTIYNYLMSASPIDATKTYAEITQTKNPGNTTCYIDKLTGNAYRWKANKEATKISELGLSLLEVASYKGISVGDCSEANKDYVEQITSSFEPVIFTDVNYRNMNQKSVLSAFVDEYMLNPDDSFKITYGLGGAYLEYPVELTIYTNEAYDASGAGEGESPLQTYDWGTSIAVMRGGGTDATLIYYDYNYDGFKNSKWKQVSGSYAVTSDSIDAYQYDYDYNGDIEGDGGGERFSLKITAYKHDEEGNPLRDEDGNILCDDDIWDSQGNLITKIRSRGLYDTFMSEYAHFLLHRKKYAVRLLCEAAELMDIPNHWEDRYEVGPLVGWINKLKSHITNMAGLEEVELEMYCL